MQSDAGAPMFSALGVSAAAERTYVALLEGSGDGDPTTMPELERHGLVHRTQDRWYPAAPDGVVGAWISARAAEDAAVRGATTQVRALYDRYQAREAPDVAVRVLRGRDVVRRTAEDFARQAQHSIDELVRGPFLTGPEVTIPDDQPDALARGVAYRVVYASALLADPSLLEVAHASIALGEQARAFADIPLRVMIVDGVRALVVLPHSAEDPRGLMATDADALVVHASPMLDALARQFLETWERATPLAPSTSGSDDARRQLITLLALGMTDAAIARSVGVSERTVHRRVAALAAEFGVTSRFQLGAEAERRGLLT